MTGSGPGRVPGTSAGTPAPRVMIRRERRLAWPRLSYIVTGTKGAVEYLTLMGYPLAISYHSPRPRDRAGAVPCDILGVPCCADGTISGAGELCDLWLAAGQDEQVIWRALAERYRRWA